MNMKPSSQLALLYLDFHRRLMFSYLDTSSTFSCSHNLIEVTRLQSASLRLEWYSSSGSVLRMPMGEGQCSSVR